MRAEYKIQIRALFKLFWVVGFALLYAWGGIDNKVLRRFIAPAWLGIGMWAFSGDWRVWLQIPLLIAGLHLGYGADTLWHKIARRMVYGLAVAVTPVSHLLDKNINRRSACIMLMLNLLICVTVIVILGVLNPVPARYEETIIGFVIGFLSMFIPNDKEQL